MSEATLNKNGAKLNGSLVPPVLSRAWRPLAAVIRAARMRQRRRRIVLMMIFLVLVAAVASYFLVARQSARPSSSGRTHLAVSRFTLHGGPVALASTDHSLWVVLETPSEKAELVRLDPASGRRMASYSIGRAGPDFGAATSVGDVVYASAGNHVIRVDALHPSRVIRATVPGSGTAITVSAGSVWVASISENQSRDAINRLDARTLTKQAQIPLSFQPISLNAGLGSIWLASTSGMWRINPLSNRVSPMNVAWEHPVSTAVSSGRLWVIQQSTLLVGIDRDGRIRNRNELPFYPGSIAASKNELWVTNNCGCKQGVVTLIDSTTGKVEGTRVVGETPVAVTTDPAGDAWVATFADGSVSRVVVRH